MEIMLYSLDVAEALFSVIDLIVAFITNILGFVTNMVAGAFNIVSIVNSLLVTLFTAIGALPVFLSVAVILSCAIGGVLILGRVL